MEALTYNEKAKKAAALLLAQNVTRQSFRAHFPAVFEEVFGRSFDMADAHDLMLSEMVHAEAYGWIVNGKTVR